MIITLNETHQPDQMDYPLMSRHLAGVILSVQKGLIADKHYQQHAAALTTLGVPLAVSAVVTGRDLVAMAQEAAAFWQRGKDLRPTFWWLVIKDATWPQLQEGLKIYRFYLQAFGAEQIGLCLLETDYPLLRSIRRRFDGLWLRTPEACHRQKPRPVKSYQLQHFTDLGNCPGCPGFVGLSRLVRPVDHRQLFGKKNKLPRAGEQWRLLTSPTTGKTRGEGK